MSTRRVPPVGVGAPVALVGSALATTSTAAGLANIIARAQHTDYHSAKMQQAIGSWAIGAELSVFPYPYSAASMLHGDPLKGRWRSAFKTLTGWDFGADHPMPDISSEKEERRHGEQVIRAYDEVTGFLLELVD